jgi:opacity protein-like surface antigen
MRPLIAAFIGLALGLPASAQEAEIGITGGYGLLRQGQLASFGGSEGGSTLVEYTDGIRIGARMSFDFRGYFAHEVSYAWQRSKFRETTNSDMNRTQTVSETSSQIHNYSYNFTAHATRRDSRVRPFVTGGVGATAFIPPGYSALQVRGQTKLGYNYGAGVKFLLSDKYGIRFDVRDHSTGKPFFSNTNGRLHIIETSMTVSYLF